MSACSRVLVCVIFKQAVCLLVCACLTVNVCMCVCLCLAHFLKCLLNKAEILCGHVHCADTVFVSESRLDGVVTTIPVVSYVALRL